MFHLVLYQPEIPQNTGSIIRLCANTGTHLHLVEPLGFTWDDRRLRRAGLDYHELTRVARHASLASCLDGRAPERVFAFSTRGGTRYDQAAFKAGDTLLFGPETRGLPAAVLSTLPEPQVLRLPMTEGSRSLNLANAAAVAVYEAWRQAGFPGGR